MGVVPQRDTYQWASEKETLRAKEVYGSLVTCHYPSPISEVHSKSRSRVRGSRRMQQSPARIASANETPRQFPLDDAHINATTTNTEPNQPATTGIQTATMNCPATTGYGS